MVLRLKRSVRNIVCLCVVLLIVVKLFIGQDSGDNDCKLQDSIVEVCQHYRDGLVSGGLCPQLCVKNHIKINRCLSSNTDYQVYEGSLYEEKEDPPTHKPVLLKRHVSKGKEFFTKPEEGSKLEDLKVMINAFLKLKLGDSSFVKLNSLILNTADFNMDGEVSLAEAKSIWALLHSNEFLMTLVLNDNENIPKLRGFCGDIFVTDALFSYTIHQSSRLASLFWGHHLSWEQKARISVGILEFVEEILDHSAGSLLLCNLNEKSIGYTSEHEAKFHSLHWIATEMAISNELKGYSCETDADCIYGDSCHSVCDKSGMCLTELVETNLQQTCKMLHLYLEDGAPSRLYYDLDRLIDRCISLNGAQQRKHLEHSVVLNDLKTMLWREISLKSDT